MSTLLLIETDGHSAKKSSLACIGAAAQLEQPLDCLVLGEHAHRIALSVATIKGVSSVIINTHPAYHQGLASNVSQLIATLASDYQYIMAATSTWSKNIMPRSAALLKVGQLSDVTAIVSADTFERPIYAGNVLVTVQSYDPIKVITLRSTAFTAPNDTQSEAPIVENHDVFNNSRVKWISATTSKSDFPSLTSADVIVSGGRAFENKAQFESLLHPLAHTLGAAVGASRAAVDAGFISNDYQIGQTGKVVAPNIYIAIGISGATQHLAGIMDSNIIIAINKDPNANIHKVATYSLITDALTAIPELLEKIQNLN